VVLVVVVYFDGDGDVDLIVVAASTTIGVPRRAPGCLRVHRGLLQPATAALVAGLSFTGAFEEEFEPVA